MKEKHFIRLEYNSKVFMSMLKSILLILLVPILVNVIIALTSLFMIEKEISGFENIMLEEMRETVNNNQQNALQVMNKLKNEDIITDYVKAENRDYWQEHRIQKLLENTIKGEESLEMVYIYFPRYDFVISSQGGEKSQYFSQHYYNCSYEEWKALMYTPWKGRTAQLEGKAKENVTLVVSSILNGKKEDEPVEIVVQLKNSWMKRKISQMCLTDNDRGFVYSEDGIVADNFEREKVGQSELYSSIIGLNKEGKDRIEAGGKKYRVKEIYSTQSGFHFVYAVCEDAAHSSVTFTKVYAIIMVAVCILLSLLLSLKITSRNYAPIKRIFSLFRQEDEALEEDFGRMEAYVQKYINNNRTLTKTVKQYEDDFKKIYLEKVLLGKIYYKDSMEEGKRLYNLEFNSPYFAVILYDLKEPGTEKEEEIINGIQNDIFMNDVWKELLESYVEEKMEYISKAYYLVVENRCLCILNGDGENEKIFEEKIKAADKNIRESFYREEKLQYVSFISGILDNLCRLNEGYQQVIKQMEERQEGFREKSGEEKNLSIRRVLDAIHENIADCNLSVSGLAEGLDVSSSYLSRFFKQQMGVGVLDYIHRYRIDLAKEIIKNDPAIKMKAVAERTGFYNAAAFIRVFKKIENVTPGQYQENIL